MSLLRKLLAQNSPYISPNRIIEYTTTDGQTVNMTVFIQDYEYFLDEELKSIPILSHTYSNGVGKIILAKDCIQIADQCFINSNLQTIRIPNSVIKLRNSCFNQTKLTSITIPDSVDYIYGSCFNQCKYLTDVTMPPSLKTIGPYVFANCKALTSLIFPEGFEHMYYSACQNCDNLSYVELPSTFNHIETYAFRNCYTLTTVKIRAVTPPSMDVTSDDKSYVFYNNASLTEILVPSGSEELYRNAEGWSYYSELITPFTE